ncbi:nucleotidyl transferase AbiEii/AbiGii toxin family protein [Cupriavidus basilensis]|uniref:Nucleotidyl transferase AbiEii/AbiGii toxin family protein n=1 Tax=Cupriavidus basilensis TaxID=68895 RepID=A0ABT6AKD6_9BURK|nr:nucleotidyl transferase AbiEii/AbiGii toxin family protein [Cupriavidus basilensis]MDF3833058.1 nucleotidyl transferase AbiEii/AbiGii toxin family protein [Cupriavidus basilensis]
MVRGLDVFQSWFSAYADQYVLIGGTAASLTMEEAGLAFRATKDLDIVLHVEALTPAFGEAFWQFVEAGGYEIRQASDTGKPIFYRFQKPADDRYPVMIELFARAPDGLQPAEDSQLTPIPLDEAVSSLSAILLDEAYYAFIMSGRREVAGLPWVGEDRLIPLKAIAWLELSERKEQGGKVDAKDVRKHLNDVLRLSQLLAPATRISLKEKIATDMTRFLAAVASDTSIDPKTLQLGNVAVADLVARIAQAYELDMPSN